MNKRNTTIDLIRLIAAFGVINLHIHSASPAAVQINNIFWPLCVPFFYIASLTYFVFTFKGQIQIGNVLSKATHRVVVPFLAWTAVYSCMFLLKGMFATKVHALIWWRVFFYGESAIQLYFMPELLIMMLTVLGIYLIFSQGAKNLILGVLFIIISAIYLAIGYQNKCFGVTSILPFCIYILSAFVFSKIMIKYANNKLFAISGILLVLLAIAINVFGKSLYVGKNLGYVPIGGVGLFLLAIGIPNANLPAWLVKFTSISFGIYLIHIIFLETIEFVMAHVLHHPLHYNIFVKLLFASVIFSLSAGSVLLLRMAPITKRFFLGEVK